MTTDKNETIDIHTTPPEEYVPVDVSIKSLLDAGAHFGHQTERWNPRMMPYIYGERNGIHIINLDITMQAWSEARKAMINLVSKGGNILVVGTKIQARDLVKQHCNRCGAFYVTSRWLGGTLTNFQTIKNSIDRMKKLEDLLAQAQDETSGVKLNKKEKLTISRNLARLDANIGGIRLMKKIPDMLFITDVAKEDIAIAEAKRLGVPVVALVDTNVDPTVVDFPIPSNDDAARTLKLFLGNLADAVLEGRKAFETRSRSDDQGGKSRGQWSI